MREGARVILVGTAQVKFAEDFDDDANPGKGRVVVDLVYLAKVLGGRLLLLKVAGVGGEARVADGVVARLCRE